MKKAFFSLLLFALMLVSCNGGKENQKKVQEEINQVTGIVSHYQKDIVYITVMRTGMAHPMVFSESAKMNIFPAPKDTVVLLYTGDLGDKIHLPKIIQVDNRPFKGTDRTGDGEELITKPRK